jgi:hypothetical protein
MEKPWSVLPFVAGTPYPLLGIRASLQAPGTSPPSTSGRDAFVWRRLLSPVSLDCEISDYWQMIAQ